MIYRTETQCRSCAAPNLIPVLEFGETPLADRLVRPRDLEMQEPRAPLTLAFCETCSLVQIQETVDPQILFGEDYPYYSSVSDGLLAHFRDSAEQLIRSRNLGRDSFVVEAASNDGYMLRNFAQAGITVQGIDPAPGPASVAISRGIPTHVTYFDAGIAERLRRERPSGVDVFLANNVLAHVADLDGFVDGMRTLLKADGVAVIEAPYVLDLVNHCEFDTVYHQHLCYFSVTALDHLFRRRGLFLNDVRRTAVHGGSLRIFVGLAEDVSQNVADLMEAERECGANQRQYYEQFADRARALAMQLNALLRDLKSSGNSLAGYGAAAKAATMLNFAGIDRELLDFVADKNEHKHGWHMGGNHIPIVEPGNINRKMPDYLLLLAWNFADEIMGSLSAYREAGGKFIVPIPSPKVV